MRSSRKRMSGDATIRRLLRQLANERAPKTFCPSEVARQLAKEWRPLMPRVRTVAAHLIADGELQCLQRGRVVSIDAARGPIRLRATPT